MDLDETFRRWHVPLFRYLARACGDAVLARDAVQETFLRLHALRNDPPRSVRPWLFTTAMNVVRDTRRTEAGRAELLRRHPEGVPGPSAAPDPDREFDRARIRTRVQEALGRLREKERTALLMREEGFKHREIADALGTTTASVGTLIARALDKLARTLEADDGDDTP